MAQYTPGQRRLLLVRPGITGAASIHYRHEEQLLTGPDWEQRYIEQIMPDKLAIELAYLDRRNFWTDLHLILLTFLILFIDDPLRHPSS